MAKMAELHELGVNDLWSYFIGVQQGYAEILDMLKKEHAIASANNDVEMLKICNMFIQYVQAILDMASLSK